ncbi:MAG: Glutamate--tRNA ligase [Myxococcota bacterium]|nr:Glutamate--tRNA ligase [Myxococcota bacterium]
MTQPRVRFAPSPTGYLHIGGARTALFNYLYARRFGGKFILRIEDTDYERSTEASVQAILDGMAWLGIDFDEGPYFQSRRIDRHKEMAAKLLTTGHVYKCFCTKEEIAGRKAEWEKEKKVWRYDRKCRGLRPDQHPDKPYVIRFKTPLTGMTAWDDGIRGRVSFANEEIEDFVLVRSDGTPVYNFVVVVDDVDMDVNLVIRGEDHISNTPKQILIYEALGAAVPGFAHLPLILNNARQKYSKRDGAVSVMGFRDEGFLPHALFNYLARLGWSHGDQEIFSREELIQYFDVKDVNKAGGVFNMEKLLWLNNHYIRQLSPEECAREVVPFLAALGIDAVDDPRLPALVKSQQERVKTLKELASSLQFYFGDEVAFDPKAAAKFLTPEYLPLYEELLRRVEAVGDFTESSLEPPVKTLAEERGEGLGKVAQPLRAALTGTTVSPGIFETMVLLGRERSLKRLGAAIRKIRGQ